jgi:glycosyltransferase involved in cell wall biosynthesis
MRALMVSSYPPRHCGIGVYARTQAEQLRADGHAVTVLSPPDGDGDVRVPFVGGRAFLRAARIGEGFDRIVVHFQPALYYRPRRPLSKVLTSAAFFLLAFRRGAVLEIVVHEADQPNLWRPDYLLLREAFRRAGRVSFHTEAERHVLERGYRARVRGSVVPHLAARAAGAGGTDRQGARRRLGIAAGAGPVFVCAGFLQASKGFDRAVEAFARAFPATDAATTVDRNGNATAAAGSAPGAALYLVGSVREETPERRAYVQALRARCAEVPGVQLVERFVPNADFDQWLTAADRVVLPYRRSWSSGVLARAQALGTPAVVTAEGGLAEQAGKDDVVVRDDDELFEALRAVPARPAPEGLPR